MPCRVRLSGVGPAVRRVRMPLGITSRMDRPLPPSSKAPSIWFAAVAPPHRNPGGNAGDVADGGTAGTDVMVCAYHATGRPFERKQEGTRRGHPLRRAG